LEGKAKDIGSTRIIEKKLTENLHAEGDPKRAKAKWVGWGGVGANGFRFQVMKKSFEHCTREKSGAEQTV